MCVNHWYLVTYSVHIWPTTWNSTSIDVFWGLVVLQTISIGNSITLTLPFYTSFVQSFHTHPITETTFVDLEQNSTTLNVWLAITTFDAGRTSCKLKYNTMMFCIRLNVFWIRKCIILKWVKFKQCTIVGITRCQSKM